MLKVYKYEEDFGRMGCLTGVFVADEKDAAEAMGKTVHLGEVLGKHSDVRATISGKTVKEVSADPVIVEFFRAHLGGSVGTDVVDALLDQQAEEDGEEA